MNYFNAANFKKFSMESVYCLLAGILPLIFTSVWMSTNTQLPGADATDYLVTAAKIYHHFTDNGIWQGLLHFNLERGWRPIFFSVFSVPFFLLAKGSVWVGYKSLALACVLASAVYVYLLAKLALDKLSAIVAANIICVLPFIQIPILTYFAEAALFPLVIGVLYHVIKADYFRNRAHSIGFIICLTLAILTRPIEAVTDLMFVFILYFGLGWYRGFFTAKQITTIVLLVLSSALVFMLYVAKHYLHHYPFTPIDGGIYDLKLVQTIYLVLKAGLAAFFVTLTLLAWQSIVMERSHPTKLGPVVRVMGTVCVLVLAWFLPYAFKTFTWIFRTSIGDLANVTANAQVQYPALQVMHWFVVSEGQLPIICSLVIAGLSLILMTNAKRKEILLSEPVVYLLLLAPFSIWEVLSTIQSAPRKLSVAFPAIILAMLLIGLQRGKLWRTRIFIVSVLAVVQFAYALNIIYPQAEFKDARYWLGEYQKPVVLEPNPHDIVYAFMFQQANQHRLKNIAIEVNVETAMPVDPFTLIMMNKLNDSLVAFQYENPTVYSEDVVTSLKHNVDAVFLADDINNMQKTSHAAANYAARFANETTPSLKLMYYLLMHYAQENLNNIGWQLGPCINVNAVDTKNYQGCLLFNKNRVLLRHLYE